MPGLSTYTTVADVTFQNQNANSLCVPLEEHYPHAKPVRLECYRVDKWRYHQIALESCFFRFSSWM